MKLSLAVLLSCVGLSLVMPVQASSNFDTRVQKILTEHYQTYRDREYFSAIQSSIQIGNQPVKTYTVGTVSRDPNSPAIDQQTLFNWGSNTKSFTAALLLKAEQERKLNLNNDFTQYLPEYKSWSGISITRLLNMTSGLPNYTDSPTLNYQVTQDLNRYWEPSQLINIVYPQVTPVPPLKSGYFYSNTAYILSGIILEKIYQQSFKTLLENSILQPYGLSNTFYPIPDYSATVQQRLARGYSYNNYSNPELTGRDVTDGSLSWAGAAGGLVGNSEDLVKWVRILFIENQLLTNSQKAQLTQLISFSTGKPLTQTSATDPKGYGLGVSQGYHKDWGNYWFYEGETLGYRAIYFYLPCNQIIVTALINSGVDNSNDHVGKLMENLHQAVAQQYFKGQKGCLASASRSGDR